MGARDFHRIFHNCGKIVKQADQGRKLAHITIGPREYQGLFNDELFFAGGNGPARSAL